MIVGLLESLLTALLLDELTDTPSDKNREEGRQDYNIVTDSPAGWQAVPWSVCHQHSV